MSKLLFWVQIYINIEMRLWQDHSCQVGKLFDCPFITGSAVLVYNTKIPYMVPQHHMPPTHIPPTLCTVWPDPSIIKLPVYKAGW